MSERYPRLLDTERVEVSLVSGGTHVLTMEKCLKIKDHLTKAVQLLEAGQPLSDSELKHGFPCAHCGAANFADAADKCRGLDGCPGCGMSDEIYQAAVDKHSAQAQPATPSVQELLSHAEVVNLDNLTKNSIIIIRGINPSQSALSPLVSIIPKGTLIWLMQDGESFETISETDMGKYGWYRKEAQTGEIDR